MKKLAFLFITLLIVSCSSDSKQEETVREIAKEDIIEKLELPEGTKFSENDIEIKQNQTADSPLGYTYIVKISVKSEDREGKEHVKTYIMEYKQVGEKGLSREDFELGSFK